MSATRLSRPSRPTSRPRLGVETLEAREVPAYVSGGTLWIDGTAGNDTVTVTYSAGSGWLGTAPKYTVKQNGTTQTFSPFLVTSGQVRFAGLGGNDSFINTSDLGARADGGFGNDTLIGGWGNDTLIGNDGNDTLDGRDGNDTVYGEKELFAFGTAGNDVINGGAGNDTLWGNGGADAIAGGPGSNWVYGGAGSDTLTGGDGYDALYGEEDADVLTGGAGFDYLDGGAGPGADTVVEAGAGDFTLTDGSLAGAGYDTLAGIEAARLTAGAGNDVLDARGFSGSAELFGGEGNDTLYGGWGDDRLHGDGGDDWLEAGSAAEFADGGPGTNYNAHKWAVWGTAPTDVNQQHAGTCVLLASLASAANRGIDLAGRVSYLGNFTYQVQLYDADQGWVGVTVPFNGTVVNGPDGPVDPAPEEADPGNCLEFWPVLYQRAYVQHFRGVDPLDGNAVAGLDGESSHERALQAVTGLSADEVGLDSILLTAFGSEYLDMIGSTMQALATAHSAMTVGGSGHAYAVLSAYQDAAGTWQVMLFNPWGYDATHQPMPFDGLGASDGVIQVPLEDVILNFGFLTYTY